MDKRTERELQRITMSTPKELGERLVETKTDVSGEDFARIALKSPKVNKRTKQMVQKLLDIGAFRTSEQVVNDDVAKQIEQYHDKEVHKGFQSGRLKKAKQDRLLRNQARALRMKRYV